MSEITIRGRIATTSLRRGETVTVEHTDAIDRLISGGFVEQVGQAAPAEPEQPAEDATDEAPTESDPEPESPRRRKKTSS